MDDLETISAPDFGRGLAGVGVNLLVRDVRAMTAFMNTCFNVSVHRLSDDFAIILHDGAYIQLHSDGTYGAHPLLDLVPENPPRGGAVQLYLFGIDPDAACARAEAAGGVVIEPPVDKPHGLREATILAPEGQAFSPAVALK